MTRSWEPRFEGTVRKFLPMLGSQEPLQSTANLQDLGLDSLSTVQLLIELEDTFNVSIPDEILNQDTFRRPDFLWDAVRQAKPL